MTEDPLPYGDTPDSSFESQYKRVFEAAECRTQVRLAEVLELRQSSVAHTKRRKAVPSEWLVKLFEKKRINPEWVRMGTGAKYLTTNAQNELPHVVKVVEVRPPAECSAQDLVNELVRRALLPLNVEALQKEIAATWLPVKERDGKL